MSKADYVFINGTVVTVDPDDTIAQAVAVKDNKIVFVGTNEEAAEWQDEAQVIDLNGRALLPGFIDAHIHFNIFGMKQGPIIDVDYDKAHSIEAIKDLIRNDAAKKGPGEWIYLWGYDQEKLDDKRHPTKEDFDEAAPNNPVYCTRACGHLGVGNSLAIEISGINDPSKYLPGEIDLDDNGNMTGLLKDGAHMDMNATMPFTEEEVFEGLIAADKIMSENGITSIHDAGVMIEDIGFVYKMMEKGARNGDLKTRMYVMIFNLCGKAKGIKNIDEFNKVGLVSGFGNDRFRIGPSKIMLDGSSSGPSSNMKEPYSHDANLPGIQVWEQEEMDEEVVKDHCRGFQMTAHCLGDKAVEMLLKSYEKAFDTLKRGDCRHRLEHCGFASEDQVDRIATMNLIPVANPGFIELNGTAYNKFYGDRTSYMFPLRSFKEKGIKAAIGSDCPIIPPNPMNSIYGAVARADGKTGDVVGENQKVDILTAIRMFTLNGAYASFEENIKGSIEKGKLADLVILSDNILETPNENIQSIKVDMTMIDGEIVFERL